MKKLLLLLIFSCGFSIAQTPQIVYDGATYDIVSGDLLTIANSYARGTQACSAADRLSLTWPLPTTLNWIWQKRTTFQADTDYVNTDDPRWTHDIITTQGQINFSEVRGLYYNDPAHPEVSGLIITTPASSAHAGTARQNAEYYAIIHHLGTRIQRMIRDAGWVASSIVIVDDNANFSARSMYIDVNHPSHPTWNARVYVNGILGGGTRVVTTQQGRALERIDPISGTDQYHPAILAALRFIITND